MPELPEVETVVRSLAPITGQRLLSAEFRNLRILRGGDPARLAARLQGTCRKISPPSIFTSNVGTRFVGS